VNNLNDVLVREGATLRETLECITKSGKRLALVVDDAGRLVGLATDGDLRKAILRGVSLEAPIEQAMNRTPVVAEPGLSPSAALALMRRRSIRQVPLVDAQRRVVDLLFFDELVALPSLPNAAVIMAGGEGKRLRPLTESTPKPMLRVGGKPLLEIMIERLRAAGIQKILLVLHYKRHVIEEHFGDGERFGVRIRYHYEDKPRGTAGSLHEALNHPGFTDHPLLVVNADILTKCYAAELMIRDAAKLIDLGQPFKGETSMTKLFATEMAVEAATLAIQVHGGYGVFEEYDVSGLLGEAKVLTLVEGTSEIQRLVIARDLLEF